MTNDITTFMQWFLQQFLTIIGWCFNTLDNITFMGTSLLKVLIAINIIGIILTIFLSIARGVGIKTTREEKVK